MMRALVTFAVLIVGIASPASASSSTTSVQPLTVLGDVPVRCRMGQPQALDGGSNTTFTQNGASSEIDFTDFVDSNTGRLNESHAQIAFPIICTGAQVLTITTQNGGLANTSVAGGTNGFAARADYTLDASWASASRSLQTDGTTASLDLSQTTPQSGQLVLNFTLVPGSQPLEAGSYDDAIVVQLNTAQ
jgi:hypothetical protein